MNVFKYQNFRKYLGDWIKLQPKNGHGVLSRWATFLGISATLMSQILADKKSMSLEMVDKLSTHLGHSEKEKDYFILLVEFDRAGTKSLKDYFLTKITLMQNESRYLKNQIEKVVELDAEAKAEYYSQWLFSGVRNLIACKGISTVEDIAQYLQLPRTAVARVLDFLLKHQLVIEQKKGWQVGPQSTYISSSSPLVYKHHQNWRIRAIQKMDQQSNEDLFYTSPMSLSQDLAQELRGKIVTSIQDIQKQVGPSDSEVVRCLNIDFFEY